MSVRLSKKVDSLPDHVGLALSVRFSDVVHAAMKGEVDDCEEALRNLTRGVYPIPDGLVVVDKTHHGYHDVENVVENAASRLGAHGKRIVRVCEPNTP